jgi:hypothetical protein
MMTPEITKNTSTPLEPMFANVAEMDPKDHLLRSQCPQRAVRLSSTLPQSAGPAATKPCTPLLLTTTRRDRLHSRAGKVEGHPTTVHPGDDIDF